jgi:hypothetical protein
VSRAVPYNKQFERTVIPNRWRAASAPFHYALAARWTAQRAAAQLQRYLARSERASVVLNPPSLALKTLRSRGAAAAPALLSCAGGERRCVVPSLSDISFGALGRVFVCRGVTAGRTYNRAGSSSRTVAAIGRVCQRLVKQAAVAPLPRWQAANVISFVRCSPLCSAAVAE